MKITHVIIHELEKESGITGANLTLFDSTVDHTDKRVVKLIMELNNRYKNRNETYGIFDKKNSTVFHRSFDNYYRINDEEAFVEFSKIASEDLKSSIKDNAPAKGGYVIFARYEYGRRFVGVFLVRNTYGLSFKTNSKDKKFDLDNVQHIDFENLAMACRINLDGFKNKEIRYLSFINKKGDEMSQYFTRWISSTDTETNEQDTKMLYDLLHKVPVPKDPETKNDIDREVFLDRVYSSIKNTPGRLVNIRSISQAFYDDPDFLPEQIHSIGMAINGEFKAHSKTLNKFIQVRAKADNVELAFPFTAFKTIVRFDEKDENQIIIKSSNLVTKIKEMIERES